MFIQHEKKNLRLHMVLAALEVEAVIGVDEVGLGAWAGPLVVAAVAMPKGWCHPEVKDSKDYHGSKKTSAHMQRLEALSELIEPAELASFIVVREPQEIDRKGIHVVLDESLKEAAQRCYQKCPNSAVVVDGSRRASFELVPPEHLIVTPKADSIVPAVSAASVMAKVTRDLLMMARHEEYPQYGFDKHVGYGTPQHEAAIQQHGLCELHRRSYRYYLHLGLRGQQSAH